MLLMSSPMGPGPAFSTLGVNSRFTVGQGFVGAQFLTLLQLWEEMAHIQGVCVTPVITRFTGRQTFPFHCSGIFSHTLGYPRVFLPLLLRK